MKITPESHPAFWKLNPQLNRWHRYRGVQVKDEEYSTHRREADRLFPHLTADERDNVALHIAHNHPGFRDPDKRTVNKLWIVVAILIALIVGLLLIPRAHAEPKQKPQAAAKTIPPPAPIKLLPSTVIPLADDSKVRILSMLREQDKLIIRRRDRTIELNELDKQIDKLSDQINQTAQAIAAKDNIDASKLVLDLDKMAWVSKEQ